MQWKFKLLNKWDVKFKHMTTRGHHYSMTTVFRPFSTKNTGLYTFVLDLLIHKLEVIIKRRLFFHINCKAYAISPKWLPKIHTSIFNLYLLSISLNFLLESLHTLVISFSHKDKEQVTLWDTFLASRKKYLMLQKKRLLRSQLIRNASLSILLPH